MKHCWIFPFILLSLVSANLRLTNYFRNTTRKKPTHLSDSSNTWWTEPQRPIVSRPGEATMFQEDWVYGRTGACGFAKPFSSEAIGMFAAVGADTWGDGNTCGSCAELQYQGRTVTVNVVDKCVACTNGWFDLGGPAWRALTGGQPPGHIYGLSWKKVSCPASLTGGNNLQVYVKPGSHRWDARFQPTHHSRPVRKMFLDGGRGWQRMSKCENFMFCKPQGLTLGGQFKLRVVSDTGVIDVKVPRLRDGSYINTGTNNDGEQPLTLRPHHQRSTTTTASTTQPTTTARSDNMGYCTVGDGVHPDPGNCRGFIKCSQGTAYSMLCYGELYFDTEFNNCNWPSQVQCNGRPVRKITSQTSSTTIILPSSSTTASTTQLSTTTTPHSSTSLSVSVGGVDCSAGDGLQPDPDNCEGFINCANGIAYTMHCVGGLYFDTNLYSCNWPSVTKCNGRPLRRRG